MYNQNNLGQRIQQEQEELASRIAQERDEMIEAIANDYGVATELEEPAPEELTETEA
jgi:hypothetical protein